MQTVEKVLSMLQQESGKQVLFSQQQTESVRYLNELNSVRTFFFYWLQPPDAMQTQSG